MRPDLLAVACALALSTAPADRQLVVHLSAARAPAWHAPPGLLAVRRLSDGLPPFPRAIAALDPDRVVLLEAPGEDEAAAALATLADDPAVEWVEPNPAREAAETPFPDDPMFVDARQWGLRNLGPAGPLPGLAGADVGAPEAWRRTTGSNDVLLALADTGIDPWHPELGGALADGRPRLEALDLAGDGSAPCDSIGHGTAVAGVFGARTGNGSLAESLGVAGLCGGDGRGNAGCRLLSLKVTRGRTSTATSFDLARAILHAARAGARAVNVSFAGEGPSRLERLAMAEAMALGCVTVAAAGNRGAVDPARAQYPAAYAADLLGIQVGASDPFDLRAAFSSHGPGLDLLAPGVDVWTTRTTYPNAFGVAGGWGRASGTSFAAPFATGAVGLLAAARPDLAAGDVQPLLRATAHDLDAPGPDQATGCGRLDVAAALAAVAPPIAIAHGVAPVTRVRADGEDTLAIDEDRVRVPATRYETLAFVSVPDSLAAPARAWTRASGTTTARGGFRLPWLAAWAEVASLEGRALTLRGWLYRTAAGAWIPAPPESARIAWTMMGARALVPPTTLRASLAASPNPFRGTTRIVSNGGGTLEILDPMGRRVRVAVLTRGAFDWDGRDDRGFPVSPGIYVARVRGRGEAARVVRLP